MNVQVRGAVSLLAVRQHRLPVELGPLVGAQDERVREHRQLSDLLADAEAVQDARRVGRDLDSGSDLHAGSSSAHLRGGRLWGRDVATSPSADACSQMVT